ncbi:hypothetical protein HOLleu_19690 [Holothuria leucospilota]|uniref:Uncharacterized protein n=1 Tax=Holothuria leucospilota TaxID=206669 RepID=A0A9Q1H559_HOLLE|nr:hypothetical protein HOLleu_19690 [Holothuria leucospilota]
MEICCNYLVLIITFIITLPVEWWIADTFDYYDKSSSCEPIHVEGYHTCKVLGLLMPEKWIVMIIEVVVTSVLGCCLKRVFSLCCNCDRYPRY